MTNLPPPPLTVAEVAARWRCSDRNVHAMIRAGKLNVIRAGKVLRIPLAAILAIEMPPAPPKATAELTGSSFQERAAIARARQLGEKRAEERAQVATENLRARRTWSRTAKKDD